jgi:hypothetical protein
MSLEETESPSIFRLRSPVIDLDQRATHSEDAGYKILEV